MIVIKKLCGEAAADAAKIEQECFSAPWSEATLTAELENPLSDFFGAYDGDTPVGYIGGRTVAAETEVFNLGVAKAYRRRGVGRLLAESFIAAVKPKTDVIFLEVRSGNLAAIRLYESLGFVFCGLRKNYYTNPTENAFLMRLAFDGTQEYEDDD